MENNVLVVDDQRDIVITLKCILEKEGFCVEAAYSGEECLQKMDTVNRFAKNMGST